MTEPALYEEMARLARSGEPFALATVIAHSGSSPRKTGTKMLIRSDLSTLGTVGGGNVEQETLTAAAAAMSSGSCSTLEFHLTEEYGYACGGGMTIFVEPQGKRPLLVMFGAGHVGRAVATLANGCGFRVTVVDERPAFAVPSLVPGADRVICAAVADAFSELRLDHESAVVIATPGHVHDIAAVRCCLATDAGFIGLLGSRRKKETVMKTLEEEGFDSSQRARVVTPVGLNIGAESPEEIAVSIVGQLIARRKGLAP
jgi:xanthine dehydrogenase accessory factor